MPNKPLFLDTVILVFCKAPIPGKVKTRLTPDFSQQQAAAIHKNLSLHILERINRLQICPVQLWCSPTIEHNFFQHCAKQFALTLHLQTDGDLGRRMYHAFLTALKDYRHAILIGCDSPFLNRDDFISTIKQLRQSADAVLSPTEDGGYSLIALKRNNALIFKNQAWGSETVCQNTLATFKTLGFNYHLLPERWDIDTPEDFARLLQTSDNADLKRQLSLAVNNH